MFISKKSYLYFFAEYFVNLLRNEKSNDFLEISFYESLFRKILRNFVEIYWKKVLEPNWHVMRQHMRSATTIDQVLKIHFEFLDGSLKECMLTDLTLFKVKIFKLKFFKLKIMTSSGTHEGFVGMSYVRTTIQQGESFSRQNFPRKFRYISGKFLVVDE